MSDMSDATGGRDLIVVLKDDDPQLSYFNLEETVHRFGGAAHRLFPLSHRERELSDGQIDHLQKMDRFYWIDAPKEELLRTIAGVLKPLKKVVETVYFKPVDQPMQSPAYRAKVTPPSRKTKDFTTLQGYLGPAPEGVGAREAWHAGGDGTGINVFDIEWNWECNHEDRPRNFNGLVFGETSKGSNHGTSVMGIIAANDNGCGVTGVSPRATVSLGAVSRDLKSPAAIVKATETLRPGDILLVEIHRPGPRYSYEERSDERGYIPIEWWPCDLLAIQFAVGCGVIVVEPAGNGEENLDDTQYSRRPSDFPDDWENPFGRGVDSGAIVVGAGAPPKGIQKKSTEVDRSRLDFSNYGSRIDAQGWGSYVMTTGGGDWQNGRNNEHRWYTSRFRGTSSAAAMVAGVLACLQSARKAAGKQLLSPLGARKALRATGSTQQPDSWRPVSERIGNRPDLAQLLCWTSRDAEDYV